MSKDRYVDGEPIEMRVRVTNCTDRVIKIKYSWPMKQSDFGGSLRLKFDSRDLLLPMVTPMGIPPPAKNKSESRIVASVKIPPRKSWDYTLFLQSFYSQPKKGKYSLSYEVEIDYTIIHAEGDEPSFSTRAKGQLAFTIAELDEKELAKVLSDYKARAASLDGLTELEGLEALRVTDSPLAVPLLCELAKERQSPTPIRALVKFPDQPDAKKAVTEAISSDSDIMIAAGLDVMAQWKRDIDIDRFKELLRNRDGLVRNSLQEYVEAMNKDVYKKLLEESQKKDK